MRVLPISTEVPKDFVALVDSDFSQIQDLLKPGRRMQAQARAKIRGMLALEAHVEPDTKVSDADVNRVVAGIRAGRSRRQVFPKLDLVWTNVDGDGPMFTVRFTKDPEAPGVRLVHGSDPSDIEPAAVREIDLQNKFHWSGADLAKKLGITEPRLVALRRHLGIDDDPSCRHVFVFGSTRIPRYSDNAMTKMRNAIVSMDMDTIWAAHNPGGRARRRPCTQPGCVASAKTLQSAGY